MSASWYLLQSGAGEAAHNMALDEALLEGTIKIGRPVLRFYGWTEPAASFGYFQKYADVERWTSLRPLIRRPTGGGLVPHDVDWTYSLVIPPTEPWYELSATESYRRVHEWICAAFQKIGIAVELASCCRKALPGQCFVGHEKFDVLWHERKVAGAAQRRNRNGLLVQGSVQPPPVQILRNDWEQSMCDAAEAFVGKNRAVFVLPTELINHAKELAAKKYAQAVYNQRR